MAVDVNTVSERIFNILKGYGYNLSIFDNSGKKVINPEDATWYAVDDPNIVVKLDKSNEEINLSVNKGEDTELLRKALKMVAQKYLLNFDFKTFNGKLSPKSEQIFISKNQEKDMSEVMEAFGIMSGSSKTSYQPLDNVKIIVKHKAPVNEELRGARSRNIHSIYVQRGEERFKMSENNLKAARAMARHLNMGGDTFDNIGTAITEMAAEQRKLKDFVRYVSSKGLVNEANQEYVTLAKENIQHIASTMQKICGVKSYATAVESLKDMSNIEVLEDDLDLESKFTETHFDGRVSDAIDSIKRGMHRKKSFEESINNAIKLESFENLRDMLHETDNVDFATPSAKLGYQVSQLGYAAQDSMLKNHLFGISKKLNSGGSLGHFEYDTIKSCLMSANQPKVKSTEGVYSSVENAYESFLETFNIL